jgi:SOS-response transcriptional repressor LexA
MDYAKWANKELDRIAEPRERTATVLALAERLGMKSKSTIYKYLEGERKFTTTQVDICAEFFGVESPARKRDQQNGDNMRSNVVPMRSTASPIDNEWITYDVLGVVEAGSWREADMLSQVEPRRAPGEKNTSYPNAKPMAWEAHGDSMNEEKIFNGTILFGVDFQDTGGILTNDMIVVVERSRGGMIERSVKAVAVFPDRTEFQPRSTNPIHKPFVYKNGHSDDDAEVRVLTVVHGTYNKF